MTELSIFDDFGHLVLASLALKRTFFQAGSLRFYSREPHWRATLGARWMHDFP